MHLPPLPPPIRGESLSRLSSQVDAARSPETSSPTPKSPFLTPPLPPSFCVFLVGFPSAAAWSIELYRRAGERGIQSVTGLHAFTPPLWLCRRAAGIEVIVADICTLYLARI